ncbi:MAG: Flp pilus assembly protein TadB [Alphaproteobacteria bacterium]|jgi:Flp pilus assembly protein TadB
MNHEKQAHMNLDDLWQQQTEMSVDTVKIAKMAKSQRRKQRLYISLDIASLLPIPFIFIYLDNITAFLKAFLLINAIAGVVMVAYFIKLRWAAAFSNHNHTGRYQQNLLQQLKNNAQIAYINKHVAWMVLLLSIIVVAVHGWSIDEEILKTIKKMGLSFAIIGAFLIPWWFWASKRQIRFEQEALNLKSILTT